MSQALIAVVALLLVAAIGIQIFYLRGFQKAGVEVTRATKVVSYANVTMLALLLLLLLGLAFSGRLPIQGTG